MNHLRILKVNPFGRRTIIEVGANDGGSFLWIAKALPWIEVVAIEPTPELASLLRDRSRETRNYRVLEFAISDEEGDVNFNISGLGEWGCSSLLEFSENRHETWLARTDLEVTERVTVTARRLDSVIRELALYRIDFLHIDAQGMDLRVLISMGDEISRLMAGAVEVPLSDEVKLYQGQHSEAEMKTFLANAGFKFGVEEFQQNEKNIYFYRGQCAFVVPK